MEEKTLPSPSIFLLLLFLPIFIIIFFNHITSRRRSSLPPGPTPWPLIGNILQLEKKLHISMTNFSKIYGPIISLRLGTQVVIVASSPSTAEEILKNQDRLLSARFTPKSFPLKADERALVSLGWDPTCSDRWKFLRSLSRSELFSAKAIESQAKLRERKLIEMIEYLKTKQGGVVNIGQIVFATVFNTISNLMFSKDLIGLEDEGKSTGVKSIVRKMMEIASAPNIADFYPVFEPLDPQGMKKKMLGFNKEMFAVWEIYIKERTERSIIGAQSSDFLDVFLANGFSDLQINWLIMEFLTAGTDTTTSTIEWGMAELLKNERVMKTIEEELDREINNATIDESLVSRLPYLNACIKETLKLHPPAPFLLPHRAPEACEIMNYIIPKDSQVLVNVWAIGRDASVWEDPLSFKPERVLSSAVDFKGHDFGLIPFGSGRRICPGLPMAARQPPLLLGYLIHFFQWSIPNGEDPNSLDMTEMFGVTLQKEQPLLLIPKLKSY